ncbi:inward rectifier potassium channel 16-like [Polyodon spathula]|uniref:inward rectifier potassium channel 16-like n=1 Tax=Polyodon spathula TaxID=7913 RepID=UPI001B7D9E30|nr:inward rectifier potassium channel 16-like [Polyodon spathula]
MSANSTNYTTILHSEKGGSPSRSGFHGAGGCRRRRYMQKDGSCNVLLQNLPGELGSYISDIFTTLVEIRWRLMFLIYSLSYILSWLLFGAVFWLIGLWNGDMEDQENEPCVYNVRSFTAAFLFSLESQTTIGYGYRCVTEECMLAVIFVTLQSIISCIIDTFIIGGVVAKMASARRRAQTVGFSDCAVIALRDGQLCLMWRIGDFRQNHMVEGTARAQLLRYQDHPTGKMTVTYRDLELSDNEILLATPALLIHKIGPASPLYGLSWQSLQQEDFELVVTFTYTGDFTGSSHQTRTSYIPAEIRWGQQFRDLLVVKEKYYKVNYSQFHKTREAWTPECSAEERDWKEQEAAPQPSDAGHGPKSSTLVREPYESAENSSNSETVIPPDRSWNIEPEEQLIKKAVLVLGSVSRESQM